MNEAEKLPVLKKALQELLPVMRQQDQITIVSYSGTARLLLPATSASEQEQILRIISELKTDALSDANQGLSLAYENALKNFIENGNNRIILATDGKFELGRKTRKLIKKSKKKQVFLSIFYFSKKEYKEIQTNLTEISELGGGTYRYVQPENAEKCLLLEAQSFIKK